MLIKKVNVWSFTQRISKSRNLLPFQIAILLAKGNGNLNFFQATPNKKIWKSKIIFLFLHIYFFNYTEKDSQLNPMIRPRTIFKNGEHCGTVLRCYPRISRNSVPRSSTQKNFPRTVFNVSRRKKTSEITFWCILDK